MSLTSWNYGLGSFQADITGDVAAYSVAASSLPTIWSSNDRVSIASAPVANATARLSVVGGIASDTLALGTSTYSESFVNNTSNAAFAAQSQASSTAVNFANTSNSYYGFSNAIGPAVAANTARSTWTSNSLVNYLPLTGGTATGNLILSGNGLGYNLFNPGGGNTTLGMSSAAGQFHGAAAPNDTVLRNTGGAKIIMSSGLVTPAFVISTSNNVGIRTATPTVPLDVVGQIRTTSGLIINSSTYTDANLNATSNTAYGAASAATFGSNAAVFSSNLAASTSATVTTINDAYYPKTGGAISGNVVLQNANNPISYSLSNSGGGGVDLGLAVGANQYVTGAAQNDFVVRNAASRRIVFLSGTAGVTPAMTLSSNNFVGIQTMNPSFPLDVTGTARATGNVISRSGIVGGSLKLWDQVGNLPVNSNVTIPLNTEPGNPGPSMFTGGFLNGTDGSGLGLAWNNAYVTIRGCMMGTTNTPSTVNATLKVYNGMSWTSLTNLTLTDRGTFQGYTTNISPPISLGSASNATQCALGISFNSVSTSNISTTYRLGAATLVTTS